MLKEVMSIEKEKIKTNAAAMPCREAERLIRVDEDDKAIIKERSDKEK